LTELRRNLEIKARDAEPRRTLEAALALGAEDHGELSQRDTYFGGARGRLKLREQAPGEPELIQYRRPDEAGPRTSEFRTVPVAAAGALKEALDAAFGTLVVVDKRRRLLLWEGVRIHLDEVDGLGTFVELEAPEDGDQQAKVERLTEALAIAGDDLVAGSYSDLLLDGPELLLNAAEAAMRNAYAPHSRFKVGAALRSPTGAIYAGANVENASYPQGQCAEASAIGAMISAGEQEIAAVAVVAEQQDPCPPCGGCRQKLAEFAKPGTPVYLGRSLTTTMGELLPLAFEFDEGSSP
jgi:homotetrameric cytidine deaminase